MDVNLQTIINAVPAAQAVIDNLNNELDAAAQEEAALTTENGVQAATIAGLNFTVQNLTAFTFPRLEQATWVEIPGVANTNQAQGGHGTSSISSNPDGSTRFSVTPGPGPNGVGYDNFFFTTQGVFIPKVGQISRVLDTIKFKVSDITKIQAIEWENQRNYPGRVANLAACVMMVSKLWAIFNFNGAVSGQPPWIPEPSIPFDPSIFSDWVTVTLETSIDDDTQSKTHVGLTINGTVYPIGFTEIQAPMQNLARWDCNFQLDTRGCAKGSVPPPFYVDMFRSLQVFYNNQLRLK